MTSTRHSRDQRPQASGRTRIDRRVFLGAMAGTAVAGLAAACSEADEEEKQPDKTLSALCEQYKAEIGLAVYDHSRRTSFTFHGSTESYEASVVKVPIALSVMRVAKEKGETLSDDQKALIEKSVGASDNDATAALFASLADAPASEAEDGKPAGGDSADAASSRAVNTTYDKLGVEKTRSNSTWGDNKTNAEDQVAVARALVHGVDWVDRGDLEFLRSLMSPTDESQNWGVGSMDKQTVQGKKVDDVDVKNGWLPDEDGTWNINSMGAVFADGNAYSVAMVSTGLKSFEEGQKVADQAVRAYFESL